MINQEIILYIQTQLAAGMPQSAIKELLITRGGWHPEDVDEAIRKAAPAPAPLTGLSYAPMQQPVRPISPSPVAASNQAAPAPAPAPKIEPVSAASAGFTLVKGMSGSPEPVRPMGAMQQNMEQPKPIPPVSSAAPAAPSFSPRPVTTAPANEKPSPLSTPLPLSVSMPLQPVSKPMQAPTPPVETMKPDIPASSKIGTAPIGPAVDAGFQPTRTAATAPSFVGMSTSINDGVTIHETTPEASAPTPRKSHGKLIAGIIAIILIIVLGGGGAYAYFFYISPAPAVALAGAIAKTSKITTGSFNATLTADFNGDAVMSLLPALPQGLTAPGTAPAASAQVKLVASGTFDHSDAASPKLDTNLAFSTSLAPLTLAFETRSIGDKFYAKVPDLGFLADLLGNNIGTLVPGDWVTFSNADVAQAAADEGAPVNPAASLTGAQESQIESLFISGGVITPTVNLGRDSSLGLMVNRYQFTVNQAALEQVLGQSYTIATGAQLPADQSSMIHQFVQGLSVTNGEIWIGIWDKLPHRIIFTVRPNGDIGQLLQDVKVDVTMSSFGTPASIIPPSSAKSLLSIIETQQKQSRDGSIQANLTAAGAQAEIFYSKHRTYVNLCSDPSLTSTFTALTSLSAPNLPYCKSSAKAYAFAATLVSSPQVACVDATKVPATLAAMPLGDSCKGSL